VGFQMVIGYVVLLSPLVHAMLVLLSCGGLFGSTEGVPGCEALYRFRSGG
jgi:hypothetical protein